jgi:hypothetical protein
MKESGMGVQRSRKTGALDVVQVLLDRMPDSAFAVDLSELRTVGDLQSGIEEGLRLLGYQLNCGGAGRSHAGGGLGQSPNRPGE